MKHVLLATALLLSVNAAYANHGKKHKPKMSKAEAKELCLTTKGADLAKKELTKCTKRAMRTGKV